MEEKSWLEELAEMAKTDEEYQQCLKALRRAQPAYLAFRDSLPEDQRKTVEDYLTACENMDQALLFLVLKKTTE